MQSREFDEECAYASAVEEQRHGHGSFRACIELFEVSWG